MGANDMPDGNSAAHSKYQLLCDQAIKSAPRFDVFDDDLMHDCISDAKLIEPVKALLRSYALWHGGVKDKGHCFDLLMVDLETLYSKVRDAHE